MGSKIGSLLGQALTQMEQAASARDKTLVVAHYGGEEDDGKLPIVVKFPTLTPTPEESWSSYRQRAEAELSGLQTKLWQVMGIDCQALLIANSLKCAATPAQIKQLSLETQIDRLELDPLVRVVQMDDAHRDLDTAAFQLRRPGVTGNGVKVAVLDSGIDTRHPWLQVADSVSTCSEDFALPGEHGTHCAGILASRDTQYRGVAPGVELVNVKVLRANGSGQHTDIVKGIDEVLDRGAQVISMSLGFNHLPMWSQGGHGWVCLHGHCPLCTAVDNAVTLENAVVVVAAGNEHTRAETLRAWGYGNTFDTELGCPGQAREAFTVGAMTKNTFLAADFSSRGPTAYGLNKPDLAAPGVNITSTIPAPRDAQGQPLPNPQRSNLFGRLSGTSMATPIVAGAAALLIELKQAAGQSWSPADIKRDLLTLGTAAGTWPANVAGVGRLVLSNL